MKFVDRIMRWHVVSPVLILLTLFVFVQVRSFEFVNFDDDIYVTASRRVQQGLNRENIAWAFKTAEAAFYHPLTWLSLMLDINLANVVGKRIGLSQPGWFHLTNVAIHLASVLLLYSALRRLTGADWRSAFVVALFAIHPLRAESVAWVTERKDVLSTMFGIGAIWGYARHAREEGRGWYALTLASFAASLLSKSMLVTLPFVFLLLDFWPLRRWKSTRLPSNTSCTLGFLSDERGEQLAKFQRPIRQLVREKLPFFALSTVACVLSYLSQDEYGAIVPLASISMRQRLLNAVIVYFTYLHTMLWPTNLAVYYPHPRAALSVGDAILPATILLAISIFVVVEFRRRPYLLAGWCWYLGTLVPVLGLVQLWTLERADRFTYFPSVGILIAVAWLMPSLIPDQIKSRRCLASIATFMVLAFAAIAHVQTSHWRNSISLFQQCLRVTPENEVAMMSLGTALRDEKKYEAALRYLSEAVRMAPDFAQAHYNLGTVLWSLRRYDEASEEFDLTLRLNPKHVAAMHNKGVVLADQNRFAEAVPWFRKSLTLKPDYIASRHTLGVVLHILGEIEEARRHLELAVELDANNARAWYDLGVLYQREISAEQARQYFRIALEVDPEFLPAREALQPSPNGLHSEK